MVIISLMSAPTCSAPRSSAKPTACRQANLSQQGGKHSLAEFAGEASRILSPSDLTTNHSWNPDTGPHMPYDAAPLTASRVLVVSPWFAFNLLYIYHHCPLLPFICTCPLPYLQQKGSSPLPSHNSRHRATHWRAPGSHQHAPCMHHRKPTHLLLHHSSAKSGMSAWAAGI